jgi:hypothetical protein
MTPRVRLLTWLAAFALAGLTARAQDCTGVAAQAERDYGVPPGLLHAIGLVESGRPDPITSHLAPWPWTVNVDGTGHFFGSAAQAVAYVRNQQARGAHSIDVGCFQISLLHHPLAFASLEQAFEPQANARYAALFLAKLRAQSGSWSEAVGRYHSATLWRGAPYREAVLARWTGNAEPAPAPRRASYTSAPGLGVMLPATRGVQITLIGVRPGRLPHVITPSNAGR